MDAELKIPLPFLGGCQYGCIVFAFRFPQVFVDAELKIPLPFRERLGEGRYEHVITKPIKILPQSSINLAPHPASPRKNFFGERSYKKNALWTLGFYLELPISLLLAGLDLTIAIRAHTGADGVS